MAARSFASLCMIVAAHRCQSCRAKDPLVCDGANEVMGIRDLRDGHRIPLGQTWVTVC